MAAALKLASVRALGKKRQTLTICTPPCFGHFEVFGQGTLFFISQDRRTLPIYNHRVSLALCCPQIFIGGRVLTLYGHPQEISLLCCYGMRFNAKKHCRKKLNFNQNLSISWQAQVQTRMYNSAVFSTFHFTAPKVKHWAKFHGV